MTDGRKMLIKDLKLIFSDKKMLLLLIALLALSAVGIFFCIKETTGPAVSFGIADEDNTEYSGLLVTYFDENEVFSSYFNVVRGTRYELADMFNKGEIDMYLIIPKDFTENLSDIINMPIEGKINSSDRTKAVLLKNLTDAYSDYISSVELNCQGVVDIMKQDGYDSSMVSSMNTKVSYELLFTALGKEDFFKRSNVERFEGISLINYFVYAGMILLILYAGLLAGLKTLKEKLGKVGDRLVSAGVGKIRIFLSGFMAFLIVYGVIMLIAVGLIYAFGDLSIPASAILFIIIAIAVSCTIFMIIARFMKSVSAYMVLGNMLILFMTIAGGGIIPIMYLPEGVATIAKFTPTYWFIKMILNTGA